MNSSSEMEIDFNLTEEEETIIQIMSEWQNAIRPKPSNCTNKIPEDSENLFYWYDLVHYAPEQEISLIGKIYNPQKNNYESCCVRLKVYKIVYLLPREVFDDDVTRKVEMKEVYDEFKETYALRHGIKEVKGKVVTKRSFNKNVPFETKYIEISCMKKDYRINLDSGRTFSMVLGNQMGFLQTFLLHCGIKGPSWLRVRNPKQNNFKFSKCAREYVCSSISSVNVINGLEIVPLYKLLIFNIKTVFNNFENNNVIVAISWIFCDKFNIETQQFNITEHCSGFYHIFGLPENFKVNNNGAKIFSTELGLLKSFLESFERFSPDVVLSYNLTGTDLDILFNKINTYKLKLTYLSCRRFKRSTLKEEYKYDLFLGKILIDLKLLSESFIKIPAHSLYELIMNVLKFPHVKIDQIFMRKFSENSIKLKELLILLIWETYCVFQLAIKLKLIPMTLELTKICGTYWNMTLKGHISNLCKFFLLHAFHEENYIIPDSNPMEGELGVYKYRGGLVLEPEIGFHKDYVVALDYFSLYPSIIREFNVCPSTFYKTNVNEYEIGVLPKVVETLQKIRLQKKLEDQDDIQQLVIKQITNGLYGYLAYEKSLFYSRGIPEFITKAGRNILNGTREIIRKKFGFDVVYGDTDSVMFKTPVTSPEEALNIAKDVQDHINSLYEFIRIEISSIYKPFFVQSKKKYAGVEIFKNDKTKSEIIYKGLEIVHRDCPFVVKYLQENILKEVFTNSSIEKDDLLQILIQFEYDLTQGKFTLDQFGITQKYNAISHQIKPSQNLCMNQQNSYNDDDYITYVFCNDGYNTAIYRIEDIRGNNLLTVDIEYYINVYIFPVIMKLLQHFGIAENEIRNCLKLPTKHGVKRKRESFRDNAKFYGVTCLNCNKEFQCNLISLDFLKGCEKCGIREDGNLSNNLILFARALFKKYLNYETVIVCHCGLCRRESSENFETVKDILRTVLESLLENRLKNEVKIIRKMILLTKFEDNDISMPFNFQRSKKTYEIPCVICDETYGFKNGALDFLNPCEKCDVNKYSKKENYFKLLLRKLIERFTSSVQICNNHLCNYAIVGGTSLRAKYNNYCLECYSGFLKTDTKVKETLDVLKHMSCILKNNRLYNLSAMVEDVLEKHEYFYVDLEQVFKEF